MDLQVKPDCRNYNSAKHNCDLVSVDSNHTLPEAIKTEPLDYSTATEINLKQVKNEHLTEAPIVKQESDSDFVEPCIISIRYQKSLQDVTCTNKGTAKLKKSPLANDSNMDLDIEDQLSTLTDLSVTTNQRKDTYDAVCPGKVYQCNECKFRSSQKYALRKHIKAHTSEKPYKLHTSEKPYKLHTSEKPYTCSKCSYRSVAMRSLEKHLITHMPEKPYKCPKCSYSGSRKLYLDVHMKTHVVNSSYKCSACEYTASQRSTLTKHFNVVHLFLPG